MLTPKPWTGGVPQMNIQGPLHALETFPAAFPCRRSVVRFAGQRASAESDRMDTVSHTRMQDRNLYGMRQAPLEIDCTPSPL